VLLAECHVLLADMQSVIMLNVIMLSVVMPNTIKASVIMLNVVMLRDVAPLKLVESFTGLVSALLSSLELC
jgi:hypothetical protein